MRNEGLGRELGVVVSGERGCVFYLKNCWNSVVIAKGGDCVFIP